MAGAIYRNKLWGYHITEDDALWLARGFIGEDGKNVTRAEAGALFWTWLQRLNFLRKPAWWSRAGAKWKLRRMVEYHAQSLSPKWLRGGSACRDNPTSWHCTEAKFQRRERNRGRTWGDINQDAPQAARFAWEAYAGTLENPISVLTYDFRLCSESLLVRGAIRVGGHTASNKGNCYYPKKLLSASDQVLAITDDTIRVEPMIGPLPIINIDIPVPTLKNPLTLLLLLPAAYLAAHGLKRLVTLWKRRQRRR